MYNPLNLYYALKYKSINFQSEMVNICSAPLLQDFTMDVNGNDKHIKLHEFLMSFSLVFA